MGYRYCWSIAGWSPPDTPTDVVTLSGVGERGTSLRSLRVMARAQQSGPLPVALIRRSGPNTGGTFAPGFVTPRSSWSDPAYGKVALYSVNPTSLGTINGIHESASLMMNTPQVGREPLRRAWEREPNGEDTAPFIGDKELFAINFGGLALIAGTLLDIFLEWEEER